MGQLPPLLAADDIRDFTRDGVVILRGLIAPQQVREWQAEWWDYIQSSPEGSPLPWPGRPRSAGVDQGAGFRPSTKLVDLPQVRALAEQLGGGKFTTGHPFEGHMIPTWPAAAEDDGSAVEWRPGTGVHLDNYGPHGWTGGFNCGFGLVALLGDAPERAGCFTYWKGSHHSTHAFFCKYPEQIDGSFTTNSDWDQFWGEPPHSSLGGRPVSRPGEQFTGQAGDVCVWHGWLMHSGSMNVATFPRLALFGSFRHQEMHMPDSPVRPPNFEPTDSPKRLEELRYRIPPLNDAWRYWGAEVQAVVAATPQQTSRL